MQCRNYIAELLFILLTLLINLREVIGGNLFNSSSVTINVVEGRNSTIEVNLKNPVDHSVQPKVTIEDRLFLPHILKQQRSLDDEKVSTFSSTGRLIVKYKEKVLSRAVKEFNIIGIMSKNGQYPRNEGVQFLSKVLSKISETAEELVGIKSATVLDALDMMIVEVLNTSRTPDYITKLSNSFLYSDEVEYVEVDQEVSLSDHFSTDVKGSLPNDPKFSEQWGMHNKLTNIDARVLLAWEHLGINSANGKYSTYNDIEGRSRRDVIVAVIDTGVDFSHPDLVDNMWINQKEYYGRPGVDDDMNGYVDDIYGYDFANNKGTPIDDEGHGTHCAGTIAAKGNNSEGISGINWNGVKIMALKFLRGSGIGFLSDSVKAINYAIKMGAHILSNSWGGGTFSQATYDAIRRSIDKNMLFIVAAGNDHNNNDVRPTYPAAYQLPNVISVAAIDYNGRLGIFSNYGHRSVDLAAPGVDILSTSAHKGYKKLSGTSMACPYVSGAAAMLYYFDPTITFDSVKSILLKSVTPLSSLRNSVRASGILNLYKAIKMMQNKKSYIEENPREVNSGGTPEHTWIVFKIPNTIGPKGSSSLQITGIGEKSGVYTASLSVSLLDSNNKNKIITSDRLKAIINVINVPKPHVSLPNGNTTNLGLSFIGLEGLRHKIPISNIGVGTLEYMAELTTVDSGDSRKKKGEFRVYPPLGTILYAKEGTTNSDLEVSCIPNTHQGIISGYLIIRYNSGLNESMVNKNAKFPNIRGNWSLNEALATFSDVTFQRFGTERIFSLSTERIAIKLYCKGYGIQVQPSSIIKFIRYTNASAQGTFLFKSLENSLKPPLILRFIPNIEDLDTDDEISDESEIKEKITPEISFFSIASGELPQKKRIFYRLNPSKNINNGYYVNSISLDETLIQNPNIQFIWYTKPLKDTKNTSIQELTNLRNSDDGIQKVKLPRPWSLLGKTVTEMYVSVNGFISFSHIFSEAFVPALPSYAPPHGILAPLWSDLTTVGKPSSQIYVSFVEPDIMVKDNKEDFSKGWKLVVDWDVDMKMDPLPNKPARFQCIIYENGHVKYNYLKLPWNNDIYNGKNSVVSTQYKPPGYTGRIPNAMVGWEGPVDARGVGIPCTNKFPLPHSTLELKPRNPRLPWFEMSDEIVPPLQTMQSNFEVKWRTITPLNKKSGSYQGKVHVTASDGADSFIPIRISIVNNSTKEEVTSVDNSTDELSIQGDSLATHEDSPSW
ncbi:S8/S53 family serine protease, putative [Cryptosporidium muris RN66]|uniref:subtilisin n=1 Tax=Cryptosporidium muris (strain RN66) TaxID=441375 RepID=B6AJH5_CRYMR|nr:S8/S53 family serine protease, putative [Cryptosporidium muris RN66]EEA08366.1 S8/S53 family serine protease, putative [Cryptosporidium muris RN66]|eukprot:XP_002142715.1 S8/S53 family serine protease [Cryptosporidium muris RN66]